MIFYFARRTGLSPAIQQECPGQVMGGVFQEMLVQQEAYDYVHGNFGQNNKIVGEVFLPKPTSGQRKYQFKIHFALHFALWTSWIVLLIDICFDILQPR